MAGSEATGMIFNPAKPTQFVVSVQHPSSTDLGLVSDGIGDALWTFDLANVVPPPCESGRRASRDGRDHGVKACAPDSRSFIRALEHAGRHRR